MSVVVSYAEFAVSCRTIHFSNEVLHHAKRALIDWFSCTLPGGLEAPATLIAKTVNEDIGRGSSTLLPSGQTATTRTAALINGTASHIIEFDDIFRDGLFHPGAPIIAAALAISEERNSTAEELLRGIVAGYEVANRIAEAINPNHYEWWHTTATVGFFGAAAASAAHGELGSSDASSSCSASFIVVEPNPLAPAAPAPVEEDDDDGGGGVAAAKDAPPASSAASAKMRSRSASVSGTGP